VRHDNAPVRYFFVVEDFFGDDFLVELLVDFFGAAFVLLLVDFFAAVLLLVDFFAVVLLEVVFFVLVLISVFFVADFTVLDFFSEDFFVVVFLASGFDSDFAFFSGALAFGLVVGTCSFSAFGSTFLLAGLVRAIVSMAIRV
jgi:hypothetical protein